MLSILYRGNDSEQNALGQFCQNILRDSFWPYEEFCLSLKIPQTFLLYRSSAPDLWQGLALGRVMGGVAELFFIFVHPISRGQGLAGEMLKDFEWHCSETYQADSVMLEVRVSNLAAIRLYEKFGYQRIHKRKRYYQDGEDAFVYSKTIKPGQEGCTE